MARVAVIGASGYTGAELVRILATHPQVDQLELYASDRGEDRRFEEEHPALRHLHQGPLRPFRPREVTGADAVFLALPHGASGAAARELVDRVERIIDLSGDLRLPDPDRYRAWYGSPSPAPELAERAVYGLPELFRAELRGARLISNPGCYPTASSLALAPALELGDMCGTEAVVTALSGATGAGRKARTHLLLSELHGNAWAYRLASHQHVPEIARTLERAGGRPVRLTFVPQVIPVERGILAVATLPLKRPVTTEELVELYRERALGCPFLRILPGRSPCLREVAGTNFCDVTVAADNEGGRLVAVAAIDNLIKGAAGQAVQNWNLAAGWSETAGLLPDRTHET